MEEWTTHDELCFLYGLALNRNSRALRGWISAAKTYGRDWGRICPAAALEYAETALRAVIEANVRQLPGPHQWVNKQQWVNKAL